MPMQGGAALVNRLRFAGADHGNHESDARQKQDEAKDRARDRGDPFLHLRDPACDGDKKAIVHVVSLIYCDIRPIDGLIGCP